MTGLDRWNFKKTTNCNDTHKNVRVGNATLASRAARISGFAFISLLWQRH